MRSKDADKEADQGRVVGKKFGGRAHRDDPVGEATRGEAADGEVDERRGEAQHAEQDAAIRGLPAKSALCKDGQPVDVCLHGAQWVTNLNIP